jgi:hypothetical protein
MSCSILISARPGFRLDLLCFLDRHRETRFSFHYDVGGAACTRNPVRAGDFPVQRNPKLLHDLSAGPAMGAVRGRKRELLGGRQLVRRRPRRPGISQFARARVSAGQVLVGVMTQTGQSASGYSYNCEFAGIANTSLPIQNVQELTWCVETLECYGLQKCSDYPQTCRTAMGGIEIETGGVPTSPVWQVTILLPIVDNTGSSSAMHPLEVRSISSTTVPLPRCLTARSSFPTQARIACRWHRSMGTCILASLCG